MRAVTFDFGQTLAEMDTTMLAGRLAERGVTVPVAALEHARPAMWRRYNEAIREGLGGHPWVLLMATLLRSAGVTEAAVLPLAEWLFSEQPRRNLWRRPIAGMIERARALRARGIPVGVISNSEGALDLLIAEMGWTDDFDVVADSGALGMEKPHRAIFDWTLARLGCDAADVVHVGDSWSADYLGARALGMRAVLFRGRDLMPADAVLVEDDRGAACESPDGLDEVLRRWGVPGGR
ncbi:MAG: putative HAD-hydrolase [Myxococcaceae bacterium]|nr:putative HAD-hydrolase [Myxococcaceae bacterium]